MKQRVTVQITTQDPDKTERLKKSDLPLEWGAISLGWNTWEVDLDLPKGWTHFAIMFGDTIVMGETP